MSQIRNDVGLALLPTLDQMSDFEVLALKDRLAATPPTKRFEKFDGVRPEVEAGVGFLSKVDTWDLSGFQPAEVATEDQATDQAADPAVVQSDPAIPVPEPAPAA